MGLIRFILISIAVIYLIRLLARLFMPYLFRKAAEKMTEKMQNQGPFQQTSYQQKSTKPEGTLSVDYVPPKEAKKPKLDNAGDFVEYEEVKAKN